MSKSPPPPVKKVVPEVELEDAVMEGDGKGKFVVRVIKVKGVPTEEKVLERDVSLPVARQAVLLWRAKAGGLHRGVK